MRLIEKIAHQNSIQFIKQFFFFRALMRENAERERLNRLREQSEQSSELSSDETGDSSSIEEETKKIVEVRLFILTIPQPKCKNLKIPDSSQVLFFLITHKWTEPLSAHSITVENDFFLIRQNNVKSAYRRLCLQFIKSFSLVFLDN